MWLFIQNYEMKKIAHHFFLAWILLACTPEIEVDRDLGIHKDPLKPEWIDDLKKGGKGPRGAACDTVTLYDTTFVSSTDSLIIERIDTVEILRIDTVEVVKFDTITETIVETVVETVEVEVEVFVPIEPNYNPLEVGFTGQVWLWAGKYSNGIVIWRDDPQTEIRSFISDREVLASKHEPAVGPSGLVVQENYFYENGRIRFEDQESANVISSPIQYIPPEEANALFLGKSCDKGAILIDNLSSNSNRADQIWIIQ